MMRATGVVSIFMLWDSPVRVDNEYCISWKICYAKIESFKKGDKMMPVKTIKWLTLTSICVSALALVGCQSKESKPPSQTQHIQANSNQQKQSQSKQNQPVFKGSQPAGQSGHSFQRPTPHHKQHPKQGKFSQHHVGAFSKSSGNGQSSSSSQQSSSGGKTYQAQGKPNMPHNTSISNSTSS